jgi:hypothetical protein
MCSVSFLTLRLDHRVLKGFTYFQYASLKAMISGRMVWKCRTTFVHTKLLLFLQNDPKISYGVFFSKVVAQTINFEPMRTMRGTVTANWTYKPAPKLVPSAPHFRFLNLPKWNQIKELIICVSQITRRMIYVAISLSGLKTSLLSTSKRTVRAFIVSVSLRYSQSQKSLHKAWRVSPLPLSMLFKTHPNTIQWCLCYPIFPAYIEDMRSIIALIASLPENI